MKKLFLMLIASALVLTACDNEKKKDADDKDKMSGTSQSQQEKNKATAIASVNAMIAGDVDATLKNVEGNAVDYGDGSMPPTKGMDSLKAALNTWRSSLSEYKGENMWAMADGDHVAVFADWSGTFKDDFMGMKVAGKSFKIKDVDIFKFNSDGKITEHHNIQSSASMMSQLGIELPK